MRFSGISSREKSVVLPVMKAGLALMAALLTFCPSLSVADGKNVTRDFVNPFSSVWNARLLPAGNDAGAFQSAEFAKGGRLP